MVAARPKSSPSQIVASSTAPASTPETVEASIAGPLETNKIPGPIDEVLRPASRTPIVAIIKKSGGGCTIEAWNTQTWQQVGDSHSLAATPEKFVLSPDGKAIAYIAKWPRRSIQVWSFDQNSVTGTIDLDEGESKLLAFSSPDRILLQRGEASHGATVEAYSVASQSLVTTPLKLPESTGGVAITITAPPLERLMAAGKRNGLPVLVQYNLLTGEELNTVNITEIDKSLPFEPRGLAYSTFGNFIAIYIEDKESRSGMLMAFNASTGKKLTKDIVWPSPLLPTAVLDKFGATENAVSWLDPLPCWMLYGRVLVDKNSGDVVSDLKFNDIVAQRITEHDRLELVTSPSGADRQVAATALDRTRIKPLLTAVPPPASEPAACLQRLSQSRRTRSPLLPRHQMFLITEKYLATTNISGRCLFGIK